MDTDPERLKEMMSFQFHRNIVGLYKKYLNMLEDIKKDHTMKTKADRLKAVAAFIQEANDE